MKFKVTTALLILLAPAAALADPISAAVILGSAGAAAAGYITVTTALLIGAGAAVFGATAQARRKARAAAAKARARANSELQDRSVTTLQAVPPKRVVYGRTITGGEIHAIFTTSKTATRTNGTTYTKPDALKHLVIAIADHECEAIHEVYIDGIAIGALDGNGYPTGGTFGNTRKVTREITIAAGASSVQPYAVTVLSAWDEGLAAGDSPDNTALVAGTYTLTSGNTAINNTGSSALRVSFTMNEPNPVVRVQKALGAASQTVNAYLNGLIPTQWTTDHRLRGIAYVILTLDLEEQRFQGGPPGITFDVSGRKVYDPRTATTAWSDNPALCIRDWLLNEWGYAVTSADIDDAYTNAAANVCDQLITLTIGGTSTTNQKRYTCNGSFTTDQAREAILEELLETMAGTAVYGAKWQVMAGAWTASVMDLGDSDLHGQIEVIQADVGMDQLVNGVRGQYVPRGKATPTDMDSYQNATFLAADGVELWDDVSYAFVDNKARARNLARIRVELARAGQIIRFPAKLRAWPLQVGDRVRVTSAEYGWTNKTYRVTDWQFGVTTAVMLTLQEDTAGIWDLADAATEDPTPNSGLPDPWEVAELTGVTATSGAANQVRREDGTLLNRVRVAWTAPTSAYVADGSGKIRIEWRRQYFDAANTWRTIEVPGDEVAAFIQGVSVGNALTIRVMAVNGLGKRGAPVVLSHVVTGDVAVTAGANLLANSSFEADTNGDGLANSWVRSSSGSVGTISVELNSPARDGAVAQRIVSSALAGGGAYHHIYQDVDLPQDFGGQPFTLSTDHRTGTGTTMRLEMTFYNSGGTALETKGKDFPSASGTVWVRNRFVAIAPATTERIRARLMQTGGSGASAAARFDRASLQLGDVQTEWAPKPDEILPATVGGTEIAPEAATKVSKLAASSFTKSIAYSTNRRTEHLKVLSWTNDTGQAVEVEVTGTISLKVSPVGGAIDNAKVFMNVGTGSPPSEGDESDITNTGYDNLETLVSTSVYTKFVDAESETVAAGATVWVSMRAAINSNTQTSTTIDVQSILLRITAVKK
jgi:hypothetical protein